MIISTQKTHNLLYFYKNKTLLFIFLIINFLSFTTFASNLEIVLNKELPNEISHNIHGYLGELPKTNDERLLFIVNARKNITKAIQALGYYRATVHIETIGEEDNKTWQLKATVTLNQPTVIKSSEIILSGDAKNDIVFQELIKQFNFQQGETLNHGKYEKLKLSLASLGLKRGYLDAKFIETRIAINQSYRDAKIHINYHSGKRFQLGHVNFKATDINQALLTQLTPFTYGEPYDVKYLRQFQNQLERTQYFNNIIIEPKNNQSIDGIIPIDVSIDSNKSHHFDFGVGYATDTEFRVSAGWKTPLVNRHGHKQETKIIYSQINPSGHFNYTIPLSSPINDVLQFDLRLEDDIYGDINSNYWSARIGRIRTNDNFISENYLRYLQENWQFEDQNNSAKYYLPGMTWSTVSRKGDPINPNKGFSQYYNVELSHQNIGSDSNFFRFYAKWKYITSFNEKHRFVARAESGFLEFSDNDTASISPSLSFYAGGDQSIRGFAYQSIGGNIPNPNYQLENNEKETLTIGGTRLLVGSVEYQYQFQDKWRAAMFFDGGSAYRKNNFKGIYSIGTGIHYLSPIGAIRLDLGYSLSKDNPSWRIHFNLGAEL